MRKSELNLNDRRVVLYGTTEARILFLQPVDEHDASLLDNEISCLETHVTEPVALAAFEVKDWNAELSPWPAPPVFGTEAFGDGAETTLRFVTDTLLPVLRERFRAAMRLGIGGYSLAGLFALWAGYQTELFSGVAAVSPSVWFPGWDEYAARNDPLARRIYLSLGDKEEKARNPVMAAVGGRIREQYARLSGTPGIVCTLEWNEGNHFRDSDLRTAKGFAWLAERDTDARHGSG